VLFLPLTGSPLAERVADDQQIERRLSSAFVPVPTNQAVPVAKWFRHSLALAADWVAVSVWTRSNLDWLQQAEICLNGAPSHDTLSRFFRHVNAAEFEKAFIRWTQLIADTVQGVIAIDGKTLRNSKDKDRGDKAVHIVSAFAAENQLILGQIATDAKSNEITAIPRLLELLDIRGATITIDAAGCQKEIAQKICGQGGDYLIALKGNQGNLYAEAHNYFLQAMEVPPAEADCDYAVTEERSRGREEKREAWMTEEISWLPQQGEWCGLKSLVCVKSSRTLKGKVSSELRLFITSLGSNALRALQSVRAHWSIENKLHWHLDVSYGEDDCKTRKDNGPENFSVIRRCTANLIKTDTKTKAGVKNRRLKAGWDRNYLMSLLEEAK
jgi:predicted transposase YbfD/YdcC